jgi:hypothetical protein
MSKPIGSSKSDMYKKSDEAVDALWRHNHKDDNDPIIMKSWAGKHHECIVTHDQPDELI